MESKLSPTTVIFEGEGILSLALQLGSLKVARELLRLGFNPLFMDSNGLSASSVAKEYLIQSSVEGQDDPARMVLTVHNMDMLKNIARLDEDLIDVSNPLRDCILGLNDLSIEDALALDSSHINSLDTMGYAPLHHAVLREDIQKTRALLRHHALVDIQIGRNLQTSLHLAAGSGLLALMSVLVSYGANVNEGTPHVGFTPLHAAASHAPNSGETIKFLLEVGADPNLENFRGSTPLHYLAESNCYWSAGDDCGSQAASYLVQHGAEINRQDIRGFTPLMSSVMCGNLVIVRCLSRIGARLDITTHSGAGVFHLLGTGVYREQVAEFSFLQIRGIDPDATTRQGHSAINIMESHARSPLVPGDRTHRDAFTFCALIVETRGRNWDSGRFLNRRDDFIQQGRRQRVYRWLGWKWQQLRDHPHLAKEKWGGIEDDGFGPLDQCEDVESVVSFCIDGLFEAKEDGEGSCPVTDALEGDGYTSEEDEFFDMEG
ncbi:ankyrin repeat-containing domain protein [Schizothecium vesticola]|uniref:Ankyrin repeat-containing domain protein n=1 Tax=Schizothecium vesticola TaxID=314040 RepID=A0AA40F443_9PEZI|nr:ankyrin repeat-containing domain protein [Schizothecium vesticola]